MSQMGVQTKQRRKNFCRPLDRSIFLYFNSPIGHATHDCDGLLVETEYALTIAPPLKSA